MRRIVGRHRHKTGPFPRLWSTAELERRQREDPLRIEYYKSVPYLPEEHPKRETIEKLWSQLLTSERASSLGINDPTFYINEMKNRNPDYRDYHYGGTNESVKDDIFFENNPIPLSQQKLEPIEEEETPIEKVFNNDFFNDFDAGYFVDTLNITGGKIRPIVNLFYQEPGFKKYHGVHKKVLHRSTKALKRWLIDKIPYTKPKATEIEELPITVDDSNEPEALVPSEEIHFETELPTDIPIASDTYMDQLEQFPNSNKYLNDWMKYGNGKGKIHQALLDADYDVDRATEIVRSKVSNTNLIAPAYIRQVVERFAHEGDDSTSSLSLHGTDEGESDNDTDTDQEDTSGTVQTKHLKIDPKAARSKEVLKELEEALEKAQGPHNPMITWKTIQDTQKENAEWVEDEPTIYVSDVIQERERPMNDIDDAETAKALVQSALKNHIYPQLAVLASKAGQKDMSARRMLEKSEPSLQQALDYLYHEDIEEVVSNAMKAHDAHAPLNAILNNIVRFSDDENALEKLQHIVDDETAAELAISLEAGNENTNVTSKMVLALQRAAQNMIIYMNMSEYIDRHKKDARGKAAVWTDPKSGRVVRTVLQTNPKPRKTKDLYTNNTPEFVRNIIVTQYGGYLRGAKQEFWPTRQELEAANIIVRPYQYGGTNAKKEIQEAYWTGPEIAQNKRKRDEKAAQAKLKKAKKQKI